MANVTVTNQLKGGTGTTAYQTPITGVVDIAKAVADSSAYVSGDKLIVDIVTLPAGTILKATDFEIVEAITASTTTDIGYDSATDPDNLVDAQTDVAVGRYTTYTAGNATTAVLTAESTIKAAFSNAGVLDSGKVAYTIATEAPANTAPELAGYRTDYTHTPAEV